MKNLLYKEFKLAAHITMYLFPALAAMVLIPTYPYFVGFWYTCLAVFFIFQYGRENKDVTFTAILPVGKADTVRARCTLVVIMEVFQIFVGALFALLRSTYAHMANDLMDASVAFFGIVFVMYAVFNITFLPIFYKSGYKSGVALLWGSLTAALVILVAEVVNAAVPAVKALVDTMAPDMIVKQLPILLAGMVIFAVVTWLACNMSIKRFERVDL